MILKGKELILVMEWRKKIDQIPHIFQMILLGFQMIIRPKRKRIRMGEILHLKK